MSGAGLGFLRGAMRRHLLLSLPLMAITLSACGGQQSDRLRFDGKVFRGKAKHIADDRRFFEVTVRPFSASQEGARQAGAYEATRYCVENFGNSTVFWSEGPFDADGEVKVERNTLILRGRCQG